MNAINYLDIDECSLQVDECDQDCNNTAGSYTCNCDGGYVLNDDGFHCDGNQRQSVIDVVNY